MDQFNITLILSLYAFGATNESHTPLHSMFEKRIRLHVKRQ